MYDYTQGVVEIEPHLLDSNESLAGALWMDAVSRVARSRGRMRLDVIIFSTMKGAAWLALPLRRNTARVDTTLSRLANELPNDRNMWDMRYVTEALACLALPEDRELETH